MITQLKGLGANTETYTCLDVLNLTQGVGELCWCSLRFLINFISIYDLLNYLYTLIDKQIHRT